MPWAALEQGEAGIHVRLGRLQRQGELAGPFGKLGQMGVVLGQLLVQWFSLLHQAEDTVLQLRGPPAEAFDVVGHGLELARRGDCPAVKPFVDLQGPVLGGLELPFCLGLADGDHVLEGGDRGPGRRLLGASRVEFGQL
jgi:hypothetical protein